MRAVFNGRWYVEAGEAADGWTAVADAVQWAREHPDTEGAVDALKAELAATDYEAIKRAEGAWDGTEEEWEAVRAHREDLRRQIRELTENAEKKTAEDAVREDEGDRRLISPRRDGASDRRPKSRRVRDLAHSVG